MTAAAAKSGGQSRRSRRRRSTKKPTVDPNTLWGDSDRLPKDETSVRITSDPAAVVRSLGRPPLSGHHNVAEHYFTAVYDRAVTLASALAAAGDLIEPDDLVNEYG
jgi:hypothetical protein